MPVVAKSRSINWDVQLRVIQREDRYFYRELWYKEHSLEWPVKSLREGLRMMHQGFKNQVKQGHQMVALTSYPHHVTDISCTMKGIVSL